MRAGIQSNLKQWNKDISQDLFKVIYSFLGFVNITVEKDDTMITPRACAVHPYNKYINCHWLYM